MAFYSRIKQELARKIRVGGLAISCGWNTGGLGKENGFEIMKVLLVPHGGYRNDTILAVERKITERTLRQAPSQMPSRATKPDAVMAESPDSSVMTIDEFRRLITFAAPSGCYSGRRFEHGIRRNSLRSCGPMSAQHPSLRSSLGAGAHRQRRSNCEEVLFCIVVQICR